MSPYTAATTGCGFLYYEFCRILPLLMSDEAERLAREEVEANQLMQVNSLSSRKKFMAEFRRRYAAVPRSFWQWFVALGEAEQRMGLLYVVLRTYKLFFDFHFNVTLPHWNGIDHRVQLMDLLFALSDIAARDSFVDGWSDATKKRMASQYLTVLRQAGMMDERTDELRPLHLDPSAYAYYLRTGEEWFLQACLLFPYEIEPIKMAAL